MICMPVVESPHVWMINVGEVRLIIIIVWVARQQGHEGGDQYEMKVETSMKGTKVQMY